MQTRRRALAGMIVPVSIPILAALLSLPVLVSFPAPAQPRSKGPVQAEPTLRDGCRLLVPPSQKVLQPRRIQPDQVKAKNAMGCLSPADAVYGANGCPLRLCGPDAGVIQFPGP